MDNDVNVITLFDEDGEEKKFDVITKLDIEDKEYVIVVPSENNSEDDDEVEAMALRIDKDSDGNDVLAVVEDDKEFQIVSEAYETLFYEEDTDDI